MLLGGYNLLNWYKTKSNRVWDKDLERQEAIIVLEKGRIPTTNLISDTNGGNVTLTAFNAETDVELGFTQTMTISQVGLNYLLYLAETLILLDDDLCSVYLKITNGDDAYYSEVFEWKAFDSDDDSEDLLKFIVTSTYLSNNHYLKAVQNGFTHTFWLNATELDPEFEPVIESKEADSIEHISYGATTKIRRFEIMGNRSIFDYLNYLPMIAAYGRGSITIEWANEFAHSAINIEVTKKNSADNNDNFAIELKYKNPWDTIMLVNNI